MGVSHIQYRDGGTTNPTKSDKALFLCRCGWILQICTSRMKSPFLGTLSVIYYQNISVLIVSNKHHPGIIQALLSITFWGHAFKIVKYMPHLSIIALYFCDAQRYFVWSPVGLLAYPAKTFAHAWRLLDDRNLHAPPGLSTLLVVVISLIGCPFVTIYSSGAGSMCMACELESSSVTKLL